jgi:hypothetical protein
MNRRDLVVGVVLAYLAAGLVCLIWAAVVVVADLVMYGF